MQHVNDLTSPPVIGEMYLVDCALYTYWCDDGEYVPIRGTLHEDRELLKFEPEHYHIDWRFIDDEYLEKSVHIYNDPNARVLHKDLIKDGSKIQTLRLLCTRLEVHWYFEKWNKMQGTFLGQRVERGQIGTAFEKEYERSTLKNMVCPHRGADLKSVPIIDGCKTCPLHGLKWCATTGRLVRQTEGKA